MTNIEKRNEYLFDKIIETWNCFENYYFHPNENKELKKYFSKCSKKSDNNFGIPDRIIFNKKVMVIIEIKSLDLNKACDDINHYLKNVSFKGILYGIAFVNENL